MGHTLDPNRYDPDFATVLSYMEEGVTPIRIKRPTTKNAVSFKMRLYSYAQAWNAEGLKLSKINPELSQACFDRAKCMARYRLRSEGCYVICENRDSESFPTSEITVGTERVTPLTVTALKQAPEPFVAPPVIMNDGMQFFEDAVKRKQEETAEAKRRMREQQNNPPEHPELKLIPKEESKDPEDGPTSPT